MLAQPLTYKAPTTVIGHSEQIFIGLTLIFSLAQSEILRSVGGFEPP